VIDLILSMVAAALAVAIIATTVAAALRIVHARPVSPEAAAVIRDALAGEGDDREPYRCACGEEERHARKPATVPTVTTDDPDADAAPLAALI